MPITRELKKRFMAIELRLEKLEGKPVQKTDGEEVAQVTLPDQDPILERLELIEMVLQIPGEKKGDTQILSAWRQQVEMILKKLEDRLKSVELRGKWTPEEARDLEKRVKGLQEKTVLGRPIHTTIEDIEKRVSKVERTPPPLNNIASKMAEDIREHEVELFGTDGTPGLTQKIKDLTESVKLLNRGVGFIMGPILITLILIRLITLLF